MKNPFSHSGKRKSNTPIGLILFLAILALHACQKTTTVVSYTIRPPKPDTTISGSNLMMAYPDTFTDGQTKSIASYRQGIMPPPPDTHFVARSMFSTISTIEVNYYPESPVSNEKVAYLIGSENEIIDSASAISSNEPVSFMQGIYFPTKVVFQLDKSLKSPVVKVVVPNETLFPEGNEVFFIKYE